MPHRVPESDERGTLRPLPSRYRLRTNHCSYEYIRRDYEYTTTTSYYLYVHLCIVLSGPSTRRSTAPTHRPLCPGFSSLPPPFRLPPSASAQPSTGFAEARNLLAGAIGRISAPAAAFHLVEGQIEGGPGWDPVGDGLRYGAHQSTSYLHTWASMPTPGKDVRRRVLGTTVPYP